VRKVLAARRKRLRCKNAPSLNCVMAHCVGISVVAHCVCNVRASRGAILQATSPRSVVAPHRAPKCDAHDTARPYI